jgi:hypothetical protein
LASVPAVDGAAERAEAGDEVYDHEADEARERERVEQQVARQVARGGRRPAVPSWDDIMFGTRRPD